jgi:general secretion pathway protein C
VDSGLASKLFSTKVVWIVTLAAIALLAYMGVYAYQRYQALAITETVTNAKPDAKQANRPAPRQASTNEIISAHLFGKEKAKAVAMQPVQAPKTSLKLTLNGILASSNPKYARAVIMVEGGKSRSYALGETIDDTDARLDKIYKDYVLLARNGKYERLVLEKAQKELDENVQKLGDLIRANRERQAQGGNSQEPQLITPNSEKVYIDSQGRIRKSTSEKFFDG